MTHDDDFDAYDASCVTLHDALRDAIHAHARRRALTIDDACVNACDIVATLFDDNDDDSLCDVDDVLRDAIKRAINDHAQRASMTNDDACDDACDAIDNVEYDDE